MPVIGIVVSAIGAEVGAALLGEALGATLAGAIGAGVANGVVASAQGGDFGKGFLSGAIGYGVGQGIQGMFGGAGAGITADEMFADQLSGFTGVGDMTGELGWGNSIGSSGTAGFGETQYFFDDQYTSAFDQNPSIIGNDNPLVETNALNSPAIDTASMSGVELPNTLDIDYGMPEYPTMQSSQQPFSLAENTSVNPFESSVNTEFTTGQYADWLDGISTSTTLDPSYQNIGADGVPQGSGLILEPLATKVTGDISTGATPTLENIATQTSVPAASQAATTNVASATQQPSTTTTTTTSAATPVSAQSFMDKMKGMVTSSDEWLGKNFGLPKGSTALGALGIGTYLYNQYQTYKAEQIAKGMKPMTLEEYTAANNPDPNRWKIAANDLAKSGRTGTLPVLTARMNQGISKDYYNNYLPNANQTWWNTNANLANARMTNMTNLSKPFYMSLGMNKGK